MLKEYLVPSAGNDHRPLLLRPRTVLFVCMVVLAFEAIFLFGTVSLVPRAKLISAIAVNALIEETNAARITNHLPALRESPILDAAAAMKANDMAGKGYFAHTSPSGTTPWYWFQKAGYDFSSAGENLAVDFSNSSDVTQAWLNSPEHRANILNIDFTDIGMAYAEGSFDGHPAIYVVELFGAPALPSFAAKTSPPPGVNARAVSVAGVSAVSAPSVAVATSAVPKAPGVGTTVPAAEVKGATITIPNPARTVDYIYFALAAVFAVALGLNVFIKVKIQHPQVILGGMLVILIAGLCIVINQHFAVPPPVVL